MTKNPHQLVRKQHFHSAKLISNFCDPETNLVEIKYKKTGEIYEKGKKSKIFTTSQTWSQHSELGYIKSIEDEFYSVLNNPANFEERNHKAITKYWYLSQLRFYFYKNPPDYLKIEGITSPSLNETQKQNLDSRGIYYVREGGIFVSQYIADMEMFANLQFFLDQNASWAWGLINSEHGKFLSADCCYGLAYLPISSKHAFLMGYTDQKISKEVLVDLNKETIKRAHSFYFARKLKECPSI